MKFNKTNFALSSGLTAATLSIICSLTTRLECWKSVMPIKNGVQINPCPMSKLGVVVGRPIITFFVAASAGWLFAFFYNKLGKE